MPNILLSKMPNFSIESCKCYSVYALSHIIASTRSYTRSPGTGPIHMDDVRCTGSELTLVACPHNDEHNCIHYEDAQVNCRQRKLGITLSTKLVIYDVLL